MSSIRHLLFDNDGILVETEDHYFAATREILAECGVEFSREQYIELCLTRSIGAWHLVPKSAGYSVDELREERNRRYTARLGTVDFAIAGVEEVLRELHGHYRMIVVTSARRIDFETIHRRTGFLRYFEHTITADEVSETKPSPEGYLAGKAHLGLGPESRDAVVIEDSRRGLLAAKAAGLPCVAIPTELTRSQDFGEAETVLPGIGELPGWLRGRV